MKNAHIIAVTTLIFSLTSSCVNDDTDFSGIITDAPIGTEQIMPSLEFDFSDFIEPEETIADGDNDYHENWNAEITVEVTYGAAGVDITDATGDCKIAVNGAHVTATLGKDNINFRLSGVSTDGSFKLYGDKRFMITLADLTLTNPAGAAINSQCGKSMYLVAEPGCRAVLSDGAAYADTGIEDMKGCIFSEGQIILSGAGRIDINAKGKNALASDDYVVVRPGVLLNIASTGGSGIKANDGVTINGGRINVEVVADGSKGINSETGIFINGGRTIILSRGAQRDETDRSVNSAAVKCDSTFTMTSGRLLTESFGYGAKGINSNIDIRLLGGDVYTATFGESDDATPRAIKTDGSLSVSATDIVAYSKHCAPVNAAGGVTIAEGYTSLEETSNLFKVTY